MLSREVEAAVRRVAESKYWKEPQAAFIVAAMSDSGMSVTAFGARFGINPQGWDPRPGPSVVRGSTL